MGLVSLTLPNDGETIDASDVNGPFNAIASVLNGNIDTVNIKDGAVTVAKFAPGAVQAALNLPVSTSPDWTPFGVLPSSVVYNGQRNYTITIPGVDYTDRLNGGKRLMFTRAFNAPNQSTKLNGTTQYWVKTSPTKMSFTNNFVGSGWIKLNAYPVAGAGAPIVGRIDTTQGWWFGVNSSGQLLLSGHNAALGNYNRVISVQSVPLNRWVHVTAQLDMSTATLSPTANYIMFDGVDVAATKVTAGTNPTSLVQAGNLTVGTAQYGGFDGFNGAISQVAVYNAKVTQATMLTYMSQGLAGTETSTASAWSFSNSVTDLNTATPNDLSVGAGAAVATNADSPFGTQASGLISQTLDYGIVHSATKPASDTILNVQAPEGCMIPTTSSGLTSVAYSGLRTPYGFPADKGRFRLTVLLGITGPTTSNATYGAYQGGAYRILIPLGAWEIGQQAGSYFAVNVDTLFNLSPVSLTGLTNTVAKALSSLVIRGLSSAAATTVVFGSRISIPTQLAATTTYTMYTLGATTASGIDGAVALAELFAENAYI